MRPSPAFAAALLALGLASAAAAAPTGQPMAPPPGTPPLLLGRPATTAPPPLAPEELRSLAEGQAQAEATAAELRALDDRLIADEVRMTQLRDWALSLERGRTASIRPVLPFHGIGYLFPHWY